MGQSFADKQERVGAPITLCKLCSYHQNVLGSTKIVNCYDESKPMRRRYMKHREVFKGSYQGHLVAANVMELRTDLPGAFAVGSIVLFDPPGDPFSPTTQGFYGEMVIWRQLQHPNIIPLLGVTINSERCSLVSNWMDNGTINEFIKMNPDANRIDLVGFHVILVSQRLTRCPSSLSLL